MKKRIIDVYSFRRDDNLFIPDIKWVGKQLVRTYGEDLEERACYTRVTNFHDPENNVLKKYGNWYLFCFECSELEHCQAGQYILKAPLYPASIKQLEEYKRTGMVKGKCHFVIAKKIVKFNNIIYNHRMARAYFLQCRYRITALRIIRKYLKQEIKKAGVNSPA